MIDTGIQSVLESSNTAGTATLSGSHASNQFSIEIVDKLLRSTRQYQKWQTIRQKNPAQAKNVAALVLERHAYITGESPRTSEGRILFDNLTDQLMAHGIHLYKSHQFKDSIFPEQSLEAKPTEPRETKLTSSQVNDTNPKITELKKRYDNKDCFEFVVGVLEDKGINYYGKGE